MFCQNCGKELDDDAMFCPACGKKRAKMPNMGNLQDVEQNRKEPSGEADAEQGRKEPSRDVDAEQSRKGPSREADAEQYRKEPGMGTETANHGTGEKELGGNIFSRIWNSPLFTKVAIKFGNLLEILEGIVFFILSKFLFNEGGFWGVAFGIFCALAGLGGCISGAISLLRWKKTGNEDEMLDETDIKKKKRNLCIGVVLIVIALVIFVNTGGGAYSIVKSISFDDIGKETIGEIVDENIKSPEWSQKKLDSNTKLVYVEGYCPAYGEDIKIEFYYEREGDSYEVTLNGIYLPDSKEELNAFEASLLWASFYN